MRAELLSSKLGEPQGQHLLDRGFVLGYVVAPDGGPLAGATFDDQGLGYEIHYFDDSLNPGGSATNRFGMFVLVGVGQPDATKTFGITGYPDARCHRVGSNPGSVFSLVYDARAPGIDCH